MAYGLEDFCQEGRAILMSDAPIQSRIDTVAEKLKSLLTDPDFVAATFTEGMPAGKRELYHDPELDFYVLAHVQEGGKRGTPHSHGSSWAIYGNVNDFTRMREFRRVNPLSEEGAVLVQSAEYDLRRGDSKGYGPDAIHSTEHPQNCWVIRVTGTDLDKIERYRFRKLRDRLLEDA